MSFLASISNRQAVPKSSTPLPRRLFQPPCLCLSCLSTLLSAPVINIVHIHSWSGKEVSKTRVSCLSRKIGNVAAQLSTRDLKKGPKASITSPPPKSQAAKFNARVLKKLQAAVDNNPDINLMTQMPINYTSRLIEFQGEDREESKEISGRAGREANTYANARLTDIFRQRSQRPQNDTMVISVIAFKLRILLTLYGLYLPPYWDYSKKHRILWNLCQMACLSGCLTSCKQVRFFGSPRSRNG
jgi:hypothetical protein